MAIPPNGYPLAAAVSPRVQIVEETGSTNADVVRHVTEEPDEWPHLSLLVTTDQRDGRGRLDRTWVTPPGTALAVSVVLRIGGLATLQRGWIPLLAGAAMTRAVSKALERSPHSATLKWPNDVLVDGAKICGILAEVVPQHPDVVVVGAGINTTMESADLPVPTATSFAALGVEIDQDRLLADYLTALREQVAALMVANDAAKAGIVAEVEALCGTVGHDVVVSLPDGSSISGRAARIDPEGRLVVADMLGVETAVAAGDVVHVR